MENKVKWRDVYEILDPADADGLDASAAIHEFRGGLSKEKAAEKAHKEYLRNHALDSAAHHYLGMRAAMATGNVGAAKRHGASYEKALNHLGLNPIDPVHQDILDRTKDADKSPYAFKAHQADSFFEPQLPVIKEKTSKERTMELLENLKQLGKR